MRIMAYRQDKLAWRVVTAREVANTKKPGERFRDYDDSNLMLRHHSGPSITPHFEIEPRWNKGESK